MEKPPERRKDFGQYVETPSGKIYETPIGRFEVIEPRILQPNDIEKNDRAIIRTASGNRYTLRHRGGDVDALLISNERDGSRPSTMGHPFLVYEGGKIAEVGKPLRYFLMLDEENRRGVEETSSVVTHIEIRRGYEAAIYRGGGEAPQPIKGPEDLARRLSDQVHGRGRKPR
jgi:hypothetical protein